MADISKVRMLNGTEYNYKDAKARSDIEGLKADLEDLEETVDSKLVTYIPYDRQLFDVSTMIPDEPYKMAVATDGTLTSNNGWRLYPIEVNGKTGEKFSFNIVANGDGEPQDYRRCGLYASNATPVVGGSVTQLGNASTTNMRGIITLDNDAKYIIIGIQSMVASYPYDSYTEACNDLMGHLVLRKSDGGYDTTYYSYEEHEKYLVVPYIQGPAASGKILQVNDNGVLELAPPPGGGGDAGSVEYIASKIVTVGSDVLGTATLGTGWSESDGVYTHTSGNTADLSFSTGLSVGDIAILDFDTSYIADEFINVGIGTSYKILVYNGTSHIRVPLKAINNTTLYITPISTFSGAISNLTLRKIQSEGTGIELPSYNVFSDNHPDNYGFWNTFLGDNTAENAVGASRSIAIGKNTLNALQGGHRNIGIGTFALSQMVGGERNTAMGADAMLEVKSGKNNVAIGDGTLYHPNMANHNVAIGSSALTSSTGATVSQNVAIGENSGGKTTGNYNTFVGHNSGYKNVNGEGNTVVGNSRGTNGSYNTLVGQGIDSDVGFSNSIGLGKGAIPTKSAQMMLGSADITEVVICSTKKIIFNSDGSVTWEELT